MFKIDKKMSERIIHTTNRVHIGEINISGINYFVKPDDELKEVIGYYLARLFHLNCAKYRSVKINNKNNSISADLNYHSLFMLAHTFSFDDMELNEIIEALRSLSFFNENLEKDMIRMYLYDILFMNDDRHDRNWGILMQEEARVALIDNGAIFRVTGKPYIRFDDSMYFNKSVSSAIYEDFLLFYESLDNENRLMVDHYIKSVTPNSIKNVFLAIENYYQCQINPLFLQIYEDHYKEILKTLSERMCNYGR